MKLFNTKRRVILDFIVCGKNYYSVEKKYWFLPFWIEEQDFFLTIEDAILYAKRHETAKYF